MPYDRPKKQTYVTSDTGIQNVMTSTSLKTKISRLNNAIEYKWLFLQTTKNSNYNPSPDNISPSVYFLFLKYRINLPLFSHRAIVNFLFSEACFEKCPNQTSLQYEIELSYLFFSFWCIPSFLLTYFEYYFCHSKYYM